MAGDLRTLGINLRKRADQIGPGVNEIKKQVTRTVVNDLAHVTPVDESTAISNWQLEIGSPASAPIEAHFLGSHGSTYGPSSYETVEQAEATLKNVQPGQKLYISNLLEYIGFLNDGSSAQEPAGFVERAVLLGRVIVAKAKIFK